MSTYAVNQEGVDALNALSQKLPELLDEIRAAAYQLNSAADDSNGLGPHAAIIEEIVESIQNSVKEAEEPVGTLSEVIADVAEGYQEIIDDDMNITP